ncbi:hypothetical protein [Mycolicibacterium celeriflavum]|uniref:Uncharacterized protein n=1 Tax=Mycolicibacterium celeriflavum TaxID=1249101 RepID=A0A1X0BL44_MYCCF|nr:hypothetical protein [Mycolicibacterium celeriflavum]MCV7239750.1 hypothetical protein [Mycolicibacterium celeriflavum]ORA43132.1 hypothetical protein BST21_22305 [Mycolicibacterium celeriflavum]BBY46565.1 hypothetical protein MCEL_48600 [Mycolicibacterium celeriflavum]
MKRFKILVVAAALLMATGLVAPPPAQAMMTLGNYDLLTNRYDRASWVWYITTCLPDKPLDCVYVRARPRLKFYAYYEGAAKLVDGRYTMTVDVPDGLRCPGQVLPTRETYSWDEVSLVGTIESHYNVGCFNGPPGMQFWTFKLQRL